MMVYVEQALCVIEIPGPDTGQQRQAIIVVRDHRRWRLTQKIR